MFSCIATLSYVLVECKWESTPIQAADVGAFFSKLHRRAAAEGIFLSMSGFTRGTKEAVISHLGDRHILLFGRGDLKALLFQPITLTDLMKSKLEKLMSKRMVLVDNTDQN